MGVKETVVTPRSYVRSVLKGGTWERPGEQTLLYVTCLFLFFVNGG